jgi:regulatory protein
VATLTDIRRTGPAFRRRTLVLDGDPWRDVPAAVVKALALSVDEEYELDDLTSQVEVAERPLARERALRLITARERSHAGLVARLTDDGYDPEVAASTAMDLARIGLVDDERFAFSSARTMANARGLGRAGIERELRAAGLADELVAAALDEALGVADEQVMARRLADATALRPGATVDKVASRLVRKGYRLPLALAVAKDAVAATRDSAGETGQADEPFGD